MIRRFSVDKMQRQLARGYRDSVWRTFHFDEGRELEIWRNNFCRMMKLKHGVNVRNVLAMQSTDPTAPGYARVQLVAEFYDPTKAGRRLKRVVAHPQTRTVNEIRDSYGLPRLGDTHVYIH